MNSLSINDFKYGYDYDEVSCFEHPIIVAMDYIGEGCGKYYAMLSKLNSIYNCKKKINYVPRKETFDEINKYWGIKIKNKKNMSFKSICEKIDLGVPVIVGVNLYSIFYSEHYLERDWNHWMLIEGYRHNGKVLKILDNAQFQDIGRCYEPFNIKYDILKKSYKDYVRKYGNDYGIFLIEKEVEVSKYSILKYIITKYMNIDICDKKSYRQQELIDMYSDLVRRDKSIHTKNDGSLVTEIKKRILNINKFRMLLFNEIKNHMIFYEYNINKKDCYEKYVECINELFNSWLNTVILSLVSATKVYKKCEFISSKIINLEMIVQKEIRKFFEYINKDGFKEKIIMDCKNKFGINDNDRRDEGWSDIIYDIENGNNVIDLKGNAGSGSVKFAFDDNVICNWWDKDNAPKILLCPATDIGEIRLDILSEYEDENSNCEVGLFLRDTENKCNYMIGYDNNCNIVFSEINVDCIKIKNYKRYNISPYICLGNNVVKYGVYMGRKKEEITEQCEINVDKCYIGIACKTWGTPGRKEIECKWDIKRKILQVN